jgi:hypothetical protein
MTHATLEVGPNLPIPADDAVQAIVSAIEDVEAAGMTAIGVTEDRLTVDDIAERASVTGTAVRYWISGGRGPGGFPQPKVARSSNPAHPHRQGRGNPGRHRRYHHAAADYRPGRASALHRPGP